MFGDDDDRCYEVVRNHEEQFSIWPAGESVPLGWETVGFAGAKSECLAHVNEVWTDMRPKSLRDRMTP
jgi:MbtH protein